MSLTNMFSNKAYLLWTLHQGSYVELNNWFFFIFTCKNSKAQKGLGMMGGVGPLGLVTFSSSLLLVIDPRHGPGCGEACRQQFAQLNLHNTQNNLNTRQT